MEKHEDPKVRGCEIENSDLMWTRSEPPRFYIVLHYPMLDWFLDDMTVVMRNQLRATDIKPDLLTWLTNLMWDSASRAAMAMREALWRDLMPRVSLTLDLFPQTPIDSGPAKFKPDVNYPDVSIFTYFWRPYGRSCKKFVKRLGWQPHFGECILDAEDIKLAFEVSRNEKFFERFGVLMRFINENCQRAQSEMSRHRIGPWAAARALLPIRLIPMVSATAVHLAIWNEVGRGWKQRKASDGPKPF